MTSSYEIVVVDTIPKKFPKAEQLVECGVPLRIASEWAKIRRQMSPLGLKRRMLENRN